MRGAIRWRWLAICIGMLALALPAGTLARPGDLDPSYAGRGFATVVFPGQLSSAADAGVLQYDGKLLLAGSVRLPGHAKLALARLKPNGRLDDAFGERGRVAKSVGSLQRPVGEAIGLDAMGRIVVAGASKTTRVFLARFLPDGTLDSSFGADGVVATGLFSLRYGHVGLEVEPSGATIVGAGSTPPDEHFGLQRYDASGTLDHAYGSDGTTVTPISGGADQIQALVPQSGGGVVAAGEACYTFGDELGFAKYSAGGQLDSSYGSGGVLTVGTCNVGGSAHLDDVALLPDGGAAALATRCSGDIHGGCSGELLELTAAGQPDASFSAGGAQGLSASGGGGLAVQADGTAVAATQTADDYPFESPGFFQLSRLDASGDPDATFGSDGAEFYDLGSTNATPEGVELQGDEKILEFGTSGNEMTAARALVTSGPPDVDADGKRDGGDRCPNLYGTHPSGCPSFSRALSLFDSRGSGVVKGRVTSAQSHCAVGKRVDIYRVFRGARRLLQRARTNAHGAFTVDLPPGSGKFLAHLPRQFRPLTGVCDAATSKVLKL